MSRFRHWLQLVVAVVHSGERFGTLWRTALQVFILPRPTEDPSASRSERRLRIVNPSVRSAGGARGLQNRHAPACGAGPPRENRMLTHGASVAHSAQSWGA